MLLVKVTRIPGTTKEVGVNDGSTVAEAMAAAGVSLEENETVKLNGVDTTTDAQLNDNDRIVIAKGAKGNA